MAKPKSKKAGTSSSKNSGQQGGGLISTIGKFLIGGTFLTVVSASLIGFYCYWHSHVAILKIKDKDGPLKGVKVICRSIQSTSWAESNPDGEIRPAIQFPVEKLGLADLLSYLINGFQLSASKDGYKALDLQSYPPFAFFERRQPAVVLKMAKDEQVKTKDFEVFGKTPVPPAEHPSDPQSTNIEIKAGDELEILEIPSLGWLTGKLEYGHEYLNADGAIDWVLDRDDQRFALKNEKPGCLIGSVGGHTFRVGSNFPRQTIKYSGELFLRMNDSLVGPTIEKDKDSNATPDGYKDNGGSVKVRITHWPKP